MFNVLTATYEEMADYALEQSRSLGRYAAVVTITTYMGDRTRTTVVVSTTPIKSQQRGGEFVGVGAQWHAGRPYGGSNRRPAAKPVVIAPEDDSDELPF